MKPSPAHQFGFVCTAAAYVSLVVILIVGTASRWDGQAAIIVLPFVLVMWVATAGILISAVIGILKNWKHSLVLMIAIVPLVVMYVLSQRA